MPSLSNTKISRLERIWIEEVGQLARFGDDMTAPERARFKTMAAQAVAVVEAEFAASAGSSGLTKKYKDLRKAGLVKKSWKLWLEDQKTAAVKVKARDYRERARRVISW